MAKDNQGASNETVQTASLTFPEKQVDESRLERPGQSRSAQKGIKVVNDTNSPVSILVSNDLLGPASTGFIQPGEFAVLPCGWAWWTVFARLWSQSSGVFLSNFKSLFAFQVEYNKKKTKVGYRDTIKVSQM